MAEKKSRKRLEQMKKKGMGGALLGEQPLGGMRGILPATTAGRSLRIVPAGSGTMLGILPSPSGRPPSGYALGMAAPRVERMPNIIPASRDDTSSTARTTRANNRPTVRTHTSDVRPPLL